MAATLQDIKRWLEQAKEKGATHMIVLCDTFDHGDYPHFVMPGEDPKEYEVGRMQRLIECYAMHLDIDAQLKERRANHFEMPESA
jgi:hypothetical protein